jgi:hypothetical protein
MAGVSIGFFFLVLVAQELRGAVRHRAPVAA